MNEAVLITSSPRGIRQRNEVAALKALHQFGPLSRAELARKLGLNRSSSGHIIAGLTSDGLVREAGESRHVRANMHVGRPGIMLELVPEAVFFVGVEIGVEHISTVEIDLAGNIISSKAEPFDGAATDVGSAIRGAVRKAFESVPSSRLERCEGFGIATPAQMDRHGFVRLAPLLGWENVALVELTREALPVAVPVAEPVERSMAFSELLFTLPGLFMLPSALPPPAGDWAKAAPENASVSAAASANVFDCMVVSIPVRR